MPLAEGIPLGIINSLAVFLLQYNYTKPNLSTVKHYKKTAKLLIINNLAVIICYNLKELILQIF